jgi:hypothetical protein
MFYNLYEIFYVMKVVGKILVGVYIGNCGVISGPWRGGEAVVFTGAQDLKGPKKAKLTSF